MRIIKILLLPVLIIILPNSSIIKPSRQTGKSIDVMKLLDKKWKYDHSYCGDTSLRLGELGDLPMEITYSKCKIDSDSPLKVIKSENEFNVCSKHDSRPFGDKSFVIIVDKLGSPSVERLRIQHYVTSGNKIGKGYYYYILHVNDDSLVIANERYYSLTTGNKLFNHVYKYR